MQHPNRYATLSSMINLRRLPVFQPGAEIPKAYRDAEVAKAEAAERRVLEITELAFVLEADGFSKAETRVAGSGERRRYLERADLVPKQGPPAQPGLGCYSTASASRE